MAIFLGNALLRLGCYDKMQGKRHKTFLYLQWIETFNVPIKQKKNRQTIKIWQMIHNVILFLITLKLFEMMFNKSINQ